MTTDTAPTISDSERVGHMAEIIVRTIRTRGRLVDPTAESAIREALSALVSDIEARSQHLRASAVKRADEYARAEERERCAKIAEERADVWLRDYIASDVTKARTGEAHVIAAAIRARGETP